ncbi:unnamed protein product, partial [Haemonchus placei]|uniref:EGF domain-specific O-linked N-acetylglucosamine transferase n=1 Tax=Haemonchus placei TaxID=6290 RepID=A0A0N4WFI1_HAEPC
LKKALETISNITVTVVDYNGKVPFLEQLASTHNSDVFIGMHGAGLTHLLFLPDWGAIMELYNCDDRNCYKDLARLRGVKYFTWAPEKVILFPFDVSLPRILGYIRTTFLQHHLIYPENDGLHPQTGNPHKKFTNYRFDPDEFVRQVKMVSSALHLAHLKYILCERSP